MALPHDPGWFSAALRGLNERRISSNAASEAASRRRAGSWQQLRVCPSKALGTSNTPQLAAAALQTGV